MLNEVYNKRLALVKRALVFWAIKYVLLMTLGVAVGLTLGGVMFAYNLKEQGVQEATFIANKVTELTYDKMAIQLSVATSAVNSLSEAVKSDRERVSRGAW